MDCHDIAKLFPNTVAIADISMNASPQARKNNTVRIKTIYA